VQVTVTEKGSYKRLLNIEVETAKLDEKFENVLKTYKKDLSLPGFRPGKVPRDMIVKRFGTALRQEAVEQAVGDSFKEACEKEKIVPIARPTVNLIENKAGAPLKYEAEIEIEPSVDITDYKDLKVKIAPAKTGDADVDKVLEEFQERMATLKSVDRPIKTGDFAELEYRKVDVEGQEKKEVKGPQHPVEIGKSGMQAFEKGLMGMKQGEEKAVEFDFPKDYADKGLAGRHAVITVLIKAVKEKERPKLDDAFAKAVSPGIENLQALRKRVREDLEAENKRVALDKAHNQAIDEVIRRNPFDVPDSRVAAYLDYSFESFQKQYPQAKVTREEFDKRNRELVIRDLKRYKILDQIAKKENLKAQQAEVDEEIRKIAEYRGAAFDQLKAEFKRTGRVMDIRDNIREQKTLYFLVGNPPEANKTE
jgi:trigger factor